MKLTNTPFHIVNTKQGDSAGSAGPTDNSAQTKNHWYSLPQKSTGQVKATQNQNLLGVINRLQGQARAATATVVGASSQQGPSIYCLAG